MPLSPETQGLIAAAEAALISARSALSQFTAASKGTPQRLTHDAYQALLDRQRLQPWTITASEQAMLEANGPMGGVAHNRAFSAACPGDAWNPKPHVVKKAQQFASVADQRRVATYAEQHKPAGGGKSYYRIRWGSGDTGRAECSQHAASMGLSLAAYRDWLWADELATATPGAHSSHQAWARRVLGCAA